MVCLQNETLINLLVKFVLYYTNECKMLQLVLYKQVSMSDTTFRKSSFERKN